MNESRLMTVKSPAFAEGKPIPAEHAMRAAGGRNISIPLEWNDPPPDTESFAIEVVDLHPVAHRWVHWLVIDLPADVRGLTAGASGASMPPGARELVNSFGTRGWGGPQPPRNTGLHDYRITLFALDKIKLEVPDDASLDQFREAAENHVLSSGSLTGTFEGQRLR